LLSVSIVNVVMVVLLGWEASWRPPVSFFNG
jgi:hypothetical protein